MNGPRIFKIKGMHCASCAVIIEKALAKGEGVTDVEVNYGTEAAKVTFDESKTSHEKLSKLIEPFGYAFAGDSDTHHHEAKSQEIEAMRRKVASILPLAFFSLALMGWDLLVAMNVVGEMSG